MVQRAPRLRWGPAHLGLWSVATPPPPTPGPPHPPPPAHPTLPPPAHPPPASSPPPPLIPPLGPRSMRCYGPRASYIRHWSYSVLVTVSHRRSQRQSSRPRHRRRRHWLCLQTLPYQLSSFVLSQSRPSSSPMPMAMSSPGVWLGLALTLVICSYGGLV